MVLPRRVQLCEEVEAALRTGARLLSGHDTPDDRIRIITDVGDDGRRAATMILMREGS
jgi:hypothetical protein